MSSEAEPSLHGPEHVGSGCAICDPQGGQPAAGRARGIPNVKVHARGEDFRIVQLRGNLFVCSRANGNCCCGWDEKGRMPFDNSLWGDEWERRKIRNKVHLTFTGCLGPCAVGNTAMLQLFGRSIWFKDLNEGWHAPAVFDYVEAMLAAAAVVPPPAALREHVYERFVPSPSAEWIPLMDSIATDDDGLDRLDPVCLMEVDPATARLRAEYGGRTIVFCAPSCRKLFLADPQAYLAV